MEGFRRERKSSKHPLFGSNFEPWSKKVKQSRYRPGVAQRVPGS
jgi:hypothetical protein